MSQIIGEGDDAVLVAGGMAATEAPPVPRVTRYEVNVWTRGSWGRADIDVIEVRSTWGRGPAHWRILYGCGLWDRVAGDFVSLSSESGAEAWAAVKYPTAEAALAEAPRAAAYVLAQWADRLAAYDRKQKSA